MLYMADLLLSRRLGGMQQLKAALQTAELAGWHGAPTSAGSMHTPGGSSSEMQLKSAVGPASGGAGMYSSMTGDTAKPGTAEGAGSKDDLHSALLHVSLQTLPEHAVRMLGASAELGIPLPRELALQMLQAGRKQVAGERPRAWRTRGNPLYWKARQRELEEAAQHSQANMNPSLEAFCHACKVHGHCYEHATQAGCRSSGQIEDVLEASSIQNDATNTPNASLGGSSTIGGTRLGGRFAALGNAGSKGQGSSENAIDLMQCMERLGLLAWSQPLAGLVIPSHVASMMRAIMHSPVQLMALGIAPQRKEAEMQQQLLVQCLCTLASHAAFELQQAAELSNTGNDVDACTAVSLLEPRLACLVRHVVYTSSSPAVASGQGLSAQHGLWGSDSRLAGGEESAGVLAESLLQSWPLLQKVLGAYAPAAVSLSHGQQKQGPGTGNLTASSLLQACSTWCRRMLARVDTVVATNCVAQDAEEKSFTGQHTCYTSLLAQLQLLKATEDAQSMVLAARCHGLAAAVGGYGSKLSTQPADVLPTQAVVEVLLCAR